MGTRVQLADLISPAPKRVPPASGLPVYSVTKHRGFVPSLEYFNKQVYSKDLSTYKVVSPGTFAYATIHLDEGSIGVAPVDCLISPMYTAFEVDESRVDSSFFIRLLKSPVLVAQYATLGRGTAERRKSISLEALGSLLINLPPIPEQRRVASMLDEVAGLRDLRARALATAKTMRGEVVRKFFDRPGRGTAVLGDLIVGYQNGLYVPAGDYGEGTSILRIADYSTGDVLSRLTLRRVRIDTAQVRRFGLAPGDIVINRVNAMSHIGKSALVGPLDQPTVFESNMMRIEVDRTKIEPAFLLAWLGTGDAVTQIQASAKQAINQASINQKDIGSLRIPTVGPGEQRELLAAIGAIESLIGSAAEHLAKLDELFASLQHRAFRADL